MYVCMFVCESDRERECVCVCVCVHVCGMYAYIHIYIEYIGDHPHLFFFIDGTVLDAMPHFGMFWAAKAIITHRWLGIGDTEKPLPRRVV